MRRVMNSMNKYIGTLAFFIVSTFLFSSCLMKREHMYHFTKQDSLYFEIYDTLKYYTFKTNKGTDTLIVKEKYLDENYNEWYWDQVDGSEFNAYFYYEGVLSHNGAEEDFHISYKKEALNQDPTMDIIFAERYAMEIRDSRNLDKTGLYKDTIIVDDSNSHQNSDEQHSFKIKSLKWHKYKGFVEYELSDGTTYIESRDDSITHSSN